MKKNKKFVFSVIVPIYNVESYLEETIQSVINQTIGFNNIELILVNDGSPDNSEDICLKYKKKYPDNIVYIKKENGGVSSARNLGLDNAHGKIINFLDSDDKWEKDVFYKVFKMFANNKDVDVIGVRQKFFEASKKYHILDYKFDKDKIVDLNDSYDHIQLSSSSTFIRKSAIGDLRFDTNLKYSEDVKFVTQVLMRELKLGIIASSLYLYRKRYNESSAIQTKNKNRAWYLDTPKLCYKYLIDLSIEKFGKVIPYVQYCICYDYQWRVRENIPSEISDSTIKKYINISKDILKYMDDEIIIEQKRLTNDYKKLILKENYKDDFDKYLSYEDGKIYFKDNILYNIANPNVLKITSLSINKKQIALKGMVNSIIDKGDYDIIIRVDGKEKKVDLFDTKRYKRYFFNKEVYHNLGFELKLDITYDSKIEFFIRYNESLIKLIPSFTVFGKLSSKLPTYYTDNGYYVRCKNNKIYINKKSNLKVLLSEIRIFFAFIKELKIKQEIYRILYFIFKIFKRKDIWLISDRTMAANDNGMNLFKYIVKNDNKNEVYFVLDKNSEDYNKMRKIGNVLPYNSLKYKLYFLLSKAVISSQADAWVYNPFGKSCKYYQDIFHYKLVFLQHGITKDDISDWLNSYSKDFSIFITAASKEYDSIVNNNDYGYGPDVVKLTGFPRYDNLTSDSKNIIAIMPTWRKELSGKNNVKTGIREYSENFKNTDYFKFYNKLINDKKLLKAMKNKGYTGIFLVHPSHMRNSIDFKENEVFKVIDGFADYGKIFKEANLLVSDFSSVPFDFAYMKKPVVYTQFDKKTFFKGHLYNEGYFSYEDDGFGPVCYNYKDSLNTILDILEKDCKMAKKYQNRVDKFYKFNDYNNSKRVYEEIVKKINGV